MRTTLLSAIIMAASFMVNCQPPKQNMPPLPSIEERIKRADEMLQKQIKLNDAQKNTINNALKTFFIAADKLMKDMPPPPSPKVLGEIQKLELQRNESVKKVLSENDYKKYAEVMNKMRPPAPGNQGNPPPPRQ